MKRLLISTALVGFATLPTFAIAQSDQADTSMQQEQTETDATGTKGDMSDEARSGTGSEGDTAEGSQAGTGADDDRSTDRDAGKSMNETGGSGNAASSSGMTSGSDDMASGNKADKAPALEGHSEVDPGTVEASEVEGTTVMSRDEEEIADVSDVLMTENGEIESIVVNVGGVLGMGSKPVEVPFDRVTLQTNDEDDEMSIVIPMSKRELEDMPEYEAG